MDEDYKLGYPASDVLRKLDWVENSDKILLETRWGIVKVLWLGEYGWHDAVDNVRQIVAVDRAMQSAEDALRLVIEILGEDSQVDWFWNSCQGHFATVTACERKPSDGAFAALSDHYVRPEVVYNATGGTEAIAVLTALVRVKARLNQISEEREKPGSEAAPEVAS